MMLLHSNYAATRKHIIILLSAQVISMVVKPVASFQPKFGVSNSPPPNTVPNYQTGKEADTAASPWGLATPSQAAGTPGTSLSRIMMEESQKRPELEDLFSIITSLQAPCKEISSMVRTATLDGHVGLEGDGGSINVQGEEQKKLDVMSNDVMKDALRWTGKVRTLASEEEDDPVPVIFDEIKVGSYTAVFDPLDGSSNIDAGIAVGTIFGIFKDEDSVGSVNSNNEHDEEQSLQDSLQAGTELVAAGYCLYSSSTILVFTTGDGVDGFTLDEQIGEFVLTHPKMTIPERGATYSFNEANRWDWDDALQKYITDIQQGLGETGENYTSRYVGSMVADVHRTLLYGGIFGYPADEKNKNGKLRLLYEAAPMSFLVEQAGGTSTTGTKRIMEIEPTKVHQRVPCILGSPQDVNEFTRYVENESNMA